MFVCEDTQKMITIKHGKTTLLRTVEKIDGMETTETILKKVSSEGNSERYRNRVKHTHTHTHTHARTHAHTHARTCTRTANRSETEK